MEADVRATATIDLSEGKVDATAKAKAKVDAGPVHLDSEVSYYSKNGHTHAHKADRHQYDCRPMLKQMLT